MIFIYMRVHFTDKHFTKKIKLYCFCFFLFCIMIFFFKSASVSVCLYNKNNFYTLFPCFCSFWLLSMVLYIFILSDFFFKFNGKFNQISKTHCCIDDNIYAKSLKTGNISFFKFKSKNVIIQMQQTFHEK